MDDLTPGEQEVLRACQDAAFNSGTFTEGTINWKIRGRFATSELESLVRKGYLQSWQQELPFNDYPTSSNPAPSRQYRLTMRGSR